jgi:hypothetical protein
MTATSYLSAIIPSPDRVNFAVHFGDYYSLDETKLNSKSPTRHSTNHNRTISKCQTEKYFFAKNRNPKKLDLDKSFSGWQKRHYSVANCGFFCHNIPPSAS